MFVVMCNGPNPVGPFASEQEAIDWAKANMKTVWWVRQLLEPTDSL